MRYLLSFLALVLSFTAFGQPLACPMPVCGDPSVITYHDPILCTHHCATLNACVTGETPINTGITADDIYSGVVPIGFTFKYYGTNYTQCIIGSNGMINFNLALAGTYDPWPINAPLLGNASAYNSICGPWCDMFPPAGGTITYATSGTAPYRRFTATWCHVPMYHPSICPEEWTTTQIILYECCNLIDVHVNHKTICAAWNGGYAIIGVQNAAGTNATVAPGRDWPALYNCNQEAWRFTPGGGGYTVAAIPFAPVPNAGSPVNWYFGAVGGALIGTGPTMPCVPMPGVYRAEVAGCDFVSTSYITIPPPGPISYDTMTVCVGGSLPLPSLPPGVWSGGSPGIATINPLPPPGFVTGIMAGTTTYTYTYDAECRYELTINVIHCGCPTCTDCVDTCYWRVTGNNIYGTRNILGTLSNHDIRIVSNNVQRAVLQAGGFLGIRQLAPTTTLNVDCVPTTAPSGLRLENLPAGHGNVMVVDPAGYVYLESSTYFKPGDPGLQDQVNELKREIADLRAQLGLSGTGTEGGSGSSITATPNPTNGQINVSYTIAGTVTNAVIKITDAQGRLLISKPVTNNTGSVTINIPASAAPGELIILLVVDGKIVARQKEVLIK